MMTPQLILLALIAAPPAQAAPRLTFNRDVRPILAESCFACHGPDKAARKADLRLDVREEALRAKAFVPGKPAESELVARIHGKGKLMPPAKSHKVLSAKQKQVLERWIAEGAEYEPHWAYITPKRPALPAVKNSSWARNPIDRFLLAEMERNGFTPAPEADRRALARRVALDLTGLPPAPALVEAFVNDTRPDAYERLVDDLLASPHWGEHRGRYWLDAARYGDTHGIHFDNYREIWAYRDWVIRAFNRNQRFDQFAIEQLAGDLLPSPSLDQLVATGFNRCNITTNEGGVIAEEYLVLYTRDRTETAAQVFMGLTANCAVCHDHKFDPVTQREFYRMAAFFNNTTQGAMDGNIHNTPPIITVPQAEDLARADVIKAELAGVRKLIEARKATARAAFAKWEADLKPEMVGGPPPAEGLLFHAPLDEGKDVRVKLTVAGKARTVGVAGANWTDGKAGKALDVGPTTKLEVKDAADLAHPAAFSYGAWVRLGPGATNGALFGRMDEGSAFRGWDLWLEGGRPGAHVIHSWPGDAVKVVAKTPLKQGQWYHLFITYDGSGKADGLQIYIDGERQKDRDVQAASLRSSTSVKVPFKLAQRNTTSRVNNFAIQDLRVYGRALSALEVGQLAGGGRIGAIAAKPSAKRTPAEKELLFGYYLGTQDQEYRKATARAAELAAEESGLRNRGTIAHISVEKAEKAMAYILFRGDYDKRRDRVDPGTPSILPPMAKDLPPNRLGFARWLVSDEHPLTARVAVNRFWQELFGTGLVRTSEDFGISGELPSHPDLLDWLAVDFRESGWDVKRLFRLMVTSAAYRQAAVLDAFKREKDPANRLISRGPRFRMDAEMVRDHALAASGLLVRRLGGPSVKPYQPDGVWEAVAMIGSNTRDYRRDTGEKLYRRSMYTFWKRSAPPASLEIFNAPNRETCTVRRERTNTPLQALVTLNDPQFVEAARFLAEKALTEGGATEDERIDYITRRLIARTLTSEERPIAREMLAALLADFKGQPDRARKLIHTGESRPSPAVEPTALAAWTMLTNALMNLDEVLNK
jgi:cytochrome c553